MLGDGRLQVVVDDAGLYDGEQVLGVDLQDAVHPREVEDQAAVGGVRAAREPGSGTAGHDGYGQRGTGAHHLLHFAGVRHPDRRERPAHGRPFRFVVAEPGQHVAVLDQGEARQRLGQVVQELAVRCRVDVVVSSRENRSITVAV